ncbi:MAG: hypothetical protein IJT16_11700 [Lachnospiraceae bacterium]|nr:hypothetical protein [Lachnospiraceae bacterium]
MDKDELTFLLMHKDIEVARLAVTEKTRIHHIVINEPGLDHLPLGAQMNMVRFHEWWEDRAVPKTRQGAKPALKKLGYSTTGDMLVDNLALSLTDCYWIRPIDSEITWAEVNLFENPFVDSFGEITINKNADVKKRSKFSLATSQGEVRKKWLVRDNGKRAMVKGNWADSYQQSINEVFAALLHSKQKVVPYTTYELLPLDVKEDNLGLGCICDCFTDLHTEFVSAWEVMQSGKKRKSENHFQYFKRLCLENGMEEEYFDRFLSYEILTDYLITNTDRHMNNIGILRDPDSLKWIGFAPIYDNGNSMFFRDANPGSVRLSEIKISSFAAKEEKQLNYVRFRDVVDLTKLPDRAEFYALYERDIPDRHNRIDACWKLFQKKVERVRALQLSAKIGNCSVIA